MSTTTTMMMMFGGAAFVGWIATFRKRRRRGRGDRRKLRDAFAATRSEELTKNGQTLLQWIVNYRDTCREKPVLSRVQPNYLQKRLPTNAPREPESWDTILSDMDEHIVPGLTHWEASNRFFAYFKPHSSYPAVLGELLCAGINVMGFDWIASPAATELEGLVLDWLAKFLNLPSKFLMSSPGPGCGVIQGSAGESATVVLLAAVVRSTGRGARSEAPPARHRLVVYCSDQTHAIVQKSTMILGVRLHKISTESRDGHRLRADALERAVSKDRESGLLPIAVVATLGTTNACGFDDLEKLGPVARRHHLWLHVDAAYGGAYACLPELRDKFGGLEFCDSFCVNCHKKLLCPFDLAALYVGDRRPLLDALSLQPEYLRNKHSEAGLVVDYEHLQMPLGRRFRALKLWFVFRRFGTSGLTEHVRNGLRLAKYFAGLIENDDEFEIAAPVSLSLVCFRWAGHDEDDQRRLLDAVKGTGECFIIHTKLGDRMVLRFACGGIEQTKSDVFSAFQVIKRCAVALNPL